MTYSIIIDNLITYNFLESKWKKRRERKKDKLCSAGGV
jgi:hypothetical protein